MKKSVVAKIIAGSTLVIGSSAFADDATSQAKAAFDSLTAQATEMSGYAWALVVLVVGATVGIKLFKKFVSRAS
ncbi:phage coat protein [Salmonella enterica subsp. enterica]|uniref:Phage coat protein n=1 Tax=Salmonella enterica I TaxID=59201 RepID=A0A3Z0PJ72_SALET|nr:phage coat protein [Salmonella enterica subsp. enterica serovar Monschaui]ECH8965689.1 phage coat protein [Salmonella enterica subsp. enterica]EJB3892367.1 phage coat protein [Salmonella enterica]EBG0229825.1 phage coat protein [Salmonella enterica subsp. enterica serovar Monschaui]EBG5365614.1 phage coat protein [Salmonella enterica subsp. enterica serovar Monschaui]